MGHAELIEILEKLPPERQAEVLDFAQFLALRSATPPTGEITDTRAAEILAALRAARESFPRSAAEQLHKEFADMRNQWDGRGWEAPR